MHPLAPPFLVFVAIAMLGVIKSRGRPQRGDSDGDLIAFGSGLLFLAYLALVAAARRPEGDSFRYAQWFDSLADTPLSSELEHGGYGAAFVIVAWLTRWIGGTAAVFFGLVAGLQFVLLIRFLRGSFRRRTTGCLLLFYSAWPYCLPYVFSGLRQGLGMCCFAVALDLHRRGRKIHWIIMLLATQFHGALVLSVAAVAGIAVLDRVVARESVRWGIVWGFWILTVGFSMTGIEVGAILPGWIDAGEKDFYLRAGGEWDHLIRGFRLDYFVLSVAPIALYFVVRRRFANPGEDSRYGWWAMRYLALNSIYNIFASAPFADRFGSLSWFLGPAVAVMATNDDGSGRAARIRDCLLLILAVVAMSLYTGDFIRDSWMLAFGN